MLPHDGQFCGVAAQNEPASPGDFATGEIFRAWAKGIREIIPPNFRKDSNATKPSKTWGFWLVHEVFRVGIGVAKGVRRWQSCKASWVLSVSSGGKRFALVVRLVRPMQLNHHEKI
jgi:hypothetical protein